MDKKTREQLKTKKAVSALDLIKKKDLINARKDKLTTVEVEDVGVFKFRIPTVEDVEKSETFDARNLAREYLVLSCCVEPCLRDGELLKAYGVVEPVEIAREIFKQGEIGKIFNILTESTGYSDEIVRIVEDIKN